MAPPKNKRSRLDIPGKSGPWRLFWMSMDPSSRRQAFKDLIEADPPTQDRLAKMRTLVDLGLWEDFPDEDSGKRPLIRKIARWFEPASFVRALDGYEARIRSAFNDSFVRAIQPNQPVEILHLLIEAGLDLKTRARTDMEDTPLLHAVRNHLLNHAVVLLEAGADCELVDARGLSPLKLAIAEFGKSPPADDRNMQLVDTLLAKGANPNALAPRDNPFQSRMMRCHYAPLWAAAATFNPLIVRRLLDAGSLVLGGLEEHADPPLVHMIECAHTQQWSVEMQKDFKDIAEMLIDAGAVLEQAGRRGLSPLLLATLMRNAPAMEALLDLGANPTSMDSQGRSLAHHLVANFEPEDDIVDRILPLIAPDCWDWKDQENLTPGDVLILKGQDPGMEDYDNRPWQTIIEHGELSSTTPSSSSVRSLGRRI